MRITLIFKDFGHDCDAQTDESENILISIQTVVPFQRLFDA